MYSYTVTTASLDVLIFSDAPAAVQTLGTIAVAKNNRAKKAIK